MPENGNINMKKSIKEISNVYKVRRLRRYCKGGKLQKYTEGGQLTPDQQALSQSGSTLAGSTMGAVGGTTGQVGGTVGVISSIANTAGQLVGDWTNTWDVNPQTGGVENLSKAKTYNSVNYALDPYKALLPTWQDPNATGMEKAAATVNMLGFSPAGVYLGTEQTERLNNEAMAKFNKGKIDQKKYENSLLAKNSSMDYTPIYANGGPMIEHYKGNTHQQGGIPVSKGGSPSAKTRTNPVIEVEDGEINWEGYIFSNNLFV